MKILLPYQFKYLGFVIAVPGIVLGYFCLIKGFQFEFLNCPVFAVSSYFNAAKFFALSRSNLTNETALLLLLLGIYFMVFAMEKDETEAILKLRYESMFKATGIQMLLYTFYTLFTFGLSYIVMLCTSMVSLPLIHLVIFHFRMRRYRKEKCN